MGGPKSLSFQNPFIRDNDIDVVPGEEHLRVVIKIFCRLVPKNHSNLLHLNISWSITLGIQWFNNYVHAFESKPEFKMMILDVPSTKTRPANPGYILRTLILSSVENYLNSVATSESSPSNLLSEIYQLVEQQVFSNIGKSIRRKDSVIV